MAYATIKERIEQINSFGLPFGGMIGEFDDLEFFAKCYTLKFNGFLIKNSSERECFIPEFCFQADEFPSKFKKIVSLSLGKGDISKLEKALGENSKINNSEFLINKLFKDSRSNEISLIYLNVHFFYDPSACSTYFFVLPNKETLKL